MRWFFTRDSDMDLAVSRVEGVDIVSHNSSWQDAFLDEDDPESDDYPAKRLIRDSRADFVVVVDFLRPVSGVTIGYHKGPLLGWAGGARGRTLVSYDKDGMSLRLLRESGARGCMVRPANFHVYVTRDQASADRMAATLRTVLWKDGAAASDLIDAIVQVKSSRYPGPDGLTPFVVS